METTTRSLSIHYAGRLALAHVLACAATTAIVIPLGGITPLSARAYFTETNIIAAVMSVIIGTVCVAVGGVINIRPTLRWFVPGREPTPGQRRAARRLVGRQSVILAATWAISGAVIALLNVQAGAAVAVPTLLGVVLGASAAMGTGILLTQDVMRPIVPAISQGSEGWITLPSVRARMILMWVLCSALPAGAIAGIIFVRANGWVIAKTAPVEFPVLVVAIGAVLLGLPMMFLTSRSISDPLGEVIDAIAKVEQGISTLRLASMSAPKSGACKVDSTGWSAVSPNANDYATCSAATSVRMSPAARLRRVHH